MDGIILDCSREELAEQGGIELTEEEKEEQKEKAYKLQKREVKLAYIPEEELERLKESYSRSIVQDFDDTYHMSKEDRKEMEERYSKFIALKKQRKKIRKIDQYIMCHRLCEDILNDVAETNGVYSPKKFKKLVLKGEIKVGGLVFPKLQGKARKTFNWDYIYENYILNRDSDPSELMRTAEGEDIEDSNIDELSKQYFGEGELNKIFDSYNPEDELEDHIIVPDEDDCSIAIEGDKKSKKMLIKTSPVILSEIKKREKLDRRQRRAKSYLTDIDESDMDFLDKYDMKRNKKKYKEGIPKFTGDINNKEDVDNYMYLMDEYERETIFVDYHGKSVNINDKNELDMQSLMDENGWNVRELYENKKAEKRLKKERKKNEKKEKMLKEMLIAVQKKKEGGKEVINGINTKKKKKGLSKKKKKKVEKKHKKELDQLDDIFMDINQSTQETFNDYRKEMENFEWKS